MPNEIKQLLEKYDITPNKVLGQNFLTDKNIVEALLNSAEISAEDIVVETGPGTGVITKELARRAKEVIGVEKDPNMISILREESKEFKNVKVVQEDILDFKISNFKFQISKQIQNPNDKKPKSYKPKAISYKLIGAPPYYLTGRLFRHFLEEADTKPGLIAVIIQKEVAEKICAEPPDMNLLAVSVQLYGEVEVVQKVSKAAFWPRPEVDSAILTVKDIKAPTIDEGLFFKVARAGFSSPRKQLAGNLSRELDTSKEKIEKMLKDSGIDPKRRAETLSIKEWENLASNFPV